MRVQLFGSLELTGIAAPLSHGKARALLVYLLLQPGRAHPRERLADLLWPDAAPAQARRGLSSALYRLRQSLGDGLAVEEGAVSLRDAAGWSVDVWEFDRLARQDEELAALRRAAELYAGELAPEIYEDWISGPRLERHERYLGVLETLCERLTERQELREALVYARRLVLAEPLREQNQQAYMRLLGRLGRRAEALAHYRQLCALFEAELNLPPLPETQTLAADLRREAEAPQMAGRAGEELPFVGRAAERARLIQRLEWLLAGQGGVLAIEGQPGIGKSRLLRELASSAGWRGISVLHGPGSNRPGASPLAPLQGAFAQALAGPRRAQIELALPDEALAACAPLFPPWRARAAMPELPPAHQRYRLEQALGALLDTLARPAPLLLLLDDWHWVDPLAWQYLASLVQLAPGRRCLIVLAWRRSEMAARAEWPLVQGWERDGQIALVGLGPLAAGDMEAAVPPAHRFQSERLWALSGGNPFLLGEALHALSQGRAPETDVATRARGLQADLRAALQCAAVLGRALPLGLWSAASGIPPERLAGLGALLVQEAFLQVAEQGYSFTHDLVQAALYQSIPLEQRQVWHARCAQAIESLAPEQQRARAFHLDHAGQREQASALYRQASLQELRLGAYSEARASLLRALELWPEMPGQQRTTTLLELARLLLIVDEAEAERVIEQAVEQAASLADRALQARAALLAGELAIKTGRREQAHTALNQAMAHAQAAADLAAQAEAHYQLGELALREGQMLEARAQCARQLALARQIGDRAQEATALQGLGFAMANSGGAAEETVGLLRQALALHRELGDRFKEAQSLLNLFSLLQSSGYLDETLALGQEALHLNQAIGYARGEAIVSGTLAQAALLLGQFEQARELIGMTRSYFQQVNDPEAIGLYTDTLGLIEERSGRPERAEDLMREALATLLEQRSEFYAAFAQLDLGSLLVRGDRPAEAAPLLERASAVFAANQSHMEHQRCQVLLGLTLSDQQQRHEIAERCWATFQSEPPEGEERQYYLWGLWQLQTRAGQTERAAEALRAAYATLQQQAQRIGEPDLRRSFFERVPINRELVEAHGQLAQTEARIGVRIVRVGVPLGRQLTPEDYIEVSWTVDAPEDQAIADRSERRRFVLKRLLAEAAAQGAAPTDADLARALSVSRRTILRDMQSLGEGGARPATRKRQAGA